MSGSSDSFGAKGSLRVGRRDYQIYRLAGIDGADTLPYSLKVLLENSAPQRGRRHRVTAEQIRALAAWDPARRAGARRSSTRRPG